MRIELKEETAEETPKKDKNDIRNKHESDLTKKEKRELERMKLGSMSLGGKLQYIWAYYKPQIFGLIGVIAVFFIGKDIYQNAQIKTSLSVMVIDSTGSAQEAAAKKLEEDLGISDDPYHRVSLDESVRTGQSQKELDTYSQMSFTTKIAAKGVDILIAPEEFFDTLNGDDYFADLTEMLPQEVYDSFGEDISKYSVTLDSKELGELLEVNYEPLKIGILSNSENSENAIKWITVLSKKL